MIIYHGSSVEVAKADVFHSRKNVDFGKGFYATPIKEQAVKWAARFKTHTGTGVVSEYEFDVESVKRNFKVLIFDGYTENWLDFIIDCRKCNDISNYDVIIGGVANDKVFNTIELFFDGLIEKTEAIKRLRYEKPNLQICIRNQKVIACALVFRGSGVI